jgi:ribose/xylose/arabinose/galactoside ABC-type transport system permease subunit
LQRRKIIVTKRKDSELEKTKPQNFFKRLIKIREATMMMSLIVVILIIGIGNPAFFKVDNIVAVLRSTSFIFIMAIAMTYVLISAELDLSVGAVLAMAGLLTSTAMFNGVPIVFAILIGLAYGVLMGLFNGLLVTKASIPSLIVTLGTMYIGRGLTLILTQGAPIYPLPDAFNAIAQGESLVIPNLVLIAVVLAVIAHIVLKHTRYGRSVYATGGNRETARLAGINVDFIRISVFVLTGVASAAAGILMASRLGSGQPSAGQGYELLVIASAIIGGTSLFGGAGTILGTAIGALLMSVIQNGMVLLKISGNWHNLVIGVIIILAVGLDQYRRKKNGVI